MLDELLPHTYNQADGHFSVPPMGRMMGFRVLVTTCVSASVAHGIGLPRGHFTHIFIDEAGQATEPEAFVSIRMMADTKTNIVLSGDPKQLGPVISSGVARELGLEISYLERLMDGDAYNLSTWYGRRFVNAYVSSIDHSHQFYQCSEAGQKFPFSQFNPKISKREVLRKRFASLCQPLDHQCLPQLVLLTFQEVPHRLPCRIRKR